MKTALDSAVHRFQAKTSRYSPEVWWDLNRLCCAVNWHTKPGEVIDVTSYSDKSTRTVQGPSRIFLQVHLLLDHDIETQRFSLVLREAFLKRTPLKLKWTNMADNTTLFMKAVFTAFQIQSPFTGQGTLDCTAEVIPIEFQS